MKRLPLLALVLLAAYPILRARYPTIGDGWNHFYRLVDLDWNLRHGILYPRWSTNLGFGYGFPVFNFYPPLTYYLAETFHLFGLRFDHSLLAVYALGFALSAFGAFELGRGDYGDRGGLVAAGAYTLAPYLYFDVFGRSALPEFLALAILPWALASVRRLIECPSRTSWALSVLSISAIVLTNIPLAVIALPALLVWSLFMWWGKRSPRSIAVVAQAFTGAAMVAGFFLLPAVLELGQIQIQQVYMPGALDFRSNFLDLRRLFGWPGPLDLGLVFPSYEMSFSLGAIGLALVGTLPAFSRRAWRQHPAGITWFILVCLTFGMLSISEPLWDVLRVGRFVQFPWRLLGPASLFLALGAARSATVIKSPWWVGLGWLGCFLASLPWTFGSSARPPVAPDLAEIREYERVTGQLGTTASAEYLPRWVREIPTPREWTEEGIVDLGALPEGVESGSSRVRPLDSKYELLAREATWLNFEAFYFPGWRASIDGRSAPIAITDPHGLMAIELPAGAHELRVWFGPTWPRTLGALVSLLGIAFTVLVFLRLPHNPPAVATTSALPAPDLHRRAVVLLTVVPMALLVARAGWIDGRATPFARSRFDGQSVYGMGQPLAVNFEDRFQLMGMDAVASAASGSAIDVALYWRALMLADADYSATLRLIDSEGVPAGQSDTQHPGGKPTSQWALDQYAADRHTLRILPGTPPGRYRLVTALYRSSDQSLLNVLGENGSPMGPTAELAEVEITRPAFPPDPAELDFDTPSGQSFGPIRLIGCTVPRASLSPGQVLSVPCYWAATGSPLSDWEVEVRLTSANGYSRTFLSPPTRADYPTSQWSTGEVVRGVLRLPIPADVPPGPVELSLGLTNEVEHFPHFPLGTLEIQAVSRTTNVPLIPEPLDVTFGRTLRLLGYELGLRSGEVQVTLFWEALAGVDRNYTVFVHLLDERGEVAAQRDAQPLGGSRPTSGWQPGEILADTYSLPAPRAAYLLEVGLYDAGTGTRLPVDSGGDRVVLGEVRVP